jgi:hypothetical protein
VSKTEYGIVGGVMIGLTFALWKCRRRLVGAAADERIPDPSALWRSSRESIGVGA